MFQCKDRLVQHKVSSFTNESVRISLSPFLLMSRNGTISVLPSPWKCGPSCPSLSRPSRFSHPSELHGLPCTLRTTLRKEGSPASAGSPLFGLLRWPMPRNKQETQYSFVSANNNSNNITKYYIYGLLEPCGVGVIILISNPPSLPPAEWQFGFASF